VLRCARASPRASEARLGQAALCRYPRARRRRATARTCFSRRSPCAPYRPPEYPCEYSGYLCEYSEYPRHARGSAAGRHAHRLCPLRTPGSPQWAYTRTVRMGLTPVDSSCAGRLRARRNGRRPRGRPRREPRASTRAHLGAHGSTALCDDAIDARRGCVRLTSCNRDFMLARADRRGCVWLTSCNRDFMLARADPQLHPAIRSLVHIYPGTIVPCDVCASPGLTRATSALGLGSPLPHLR
jgi:hypothetical protein